MSTILSAIVGSLVVLVATIMLISMFGRKNHFDVAGNTAIVTGASQGLGLSLAKQLAERGANVVIVAQTESKLQQALVQIKSCAASDQQRFLYLSYDLRSPESAPAIIEKVKSWNNGHAPDIVLNCAGNCSPGFFASSDIETHRSQMDTVYWSCAYLAHATLQEWTKSSSSPLHAAEPTRHLIFTSSVVAFFALAGYAPYTPAKAAMRGLADTLNQEVEVYNGARMSNKEQGPPAEIKVHIAFPTAIDSPGYDNEQKTKPKLTQLLEKDDTPLDPDVLAKDLILGLEAGQFILTSTFIGNAMRGWGHGGSQRTSLLDYLWGWLGSIIVLFVVPNYLAKCRAWGREHGMSGAK